MQTIMMTVSHSLRGGSGCESLAKEKPVTRSGQPDTAAIAPRGGR
ncbi:hypothetical protein [Paraburkholderia caballeronis]|nr:hypothetical protein [Paraburkholderia caballeronis]